MPQFCSPDRLALIAAFSLALGGGAQARVHKMAPYPPQDQCNQTFTGDGCGSEAPGAAFQRNPSGFAAYATGYDPGLIASGAEAGKTRAQALTDAINGVGLFTGAKQINFNLPGVAYPVGHNPATLVQARYYAAQVGFPAGCSYASTGGGANGTSPVVACTGNIGAAVIRNVDFTNGGSDCVTLQIMNAVGALTVDNFKMEYRGNCRGVAPRGQNAWLINAFAPNNGFTSLTLKNFIIDSNPSDCSDCMNRPLNADIIDQAGGGGSHSLKMSYFAAINNTGRVVNGGYNAFRLSVDHFYIEGVSMGCLVYGQHGESDALTVPSSTTGNSQTWSYGVFVIPPQQPHSTAIGGRGCLTAPIYFSTGAGGTGSSWTDEEGHVLSIINPPVRADALTRHDVASGATVEISYDNFPNSSDVYVHDVWADPRGADSCAINAGGSTGAGATSPTLNIVDLYDGSVVTNFDFGAVPCNGHGTP